MAVNYIEEATKYPISSSVNEREERMMRTMLVFLTMLLVAACTDEPIVNPDCEKLINGIMENNETHVKTEIEKLTAELEPQPTTEDRWGHRNNLTELANKLSEKCGSITATVECYACRYTYPPTSELRLEFVYNDEDRTVIIDLFTPKDDILRYAGMHSFVTGEE